MSGPIWLFASLGQNHAAGIITNDTLWLWGRNNFGQIGNNSSVINNFSSPVQVSGGGSWSYISLGYGTSAGIKTNGALWLWGRNDSGELAVGNVINYSSPVQSLDLSSAWTSVSVGYNHVGAIKNDGSLWLWGDNAYGSIGNDSTISYSSPVQTNIAGNDWLSVSAGKKFTLAIKNDGTFWSWGL